MSDFPTPGVSERRETVPVSSTPGNVNPTAAFSSQKTGPNKYLFTDLSIDPDGEIVGWRWDFGDALPPTAFFTVTTNLLAAVFKNESTAQAPKALVSYLWNFGDNTTSTVANPVHTYSAPGSYDVSLVVTDNGAPAQSSVAFHRTVNVQTGGAVGKPQGAFSQMASATARKVNTQHFTMTHDFTDPSTIVARIGAARAGNFRLSIALAGGEHSLYTINGKFDLGPNWPQSLAGSKWANRVDLFKNNTTVRNAIRDAVDEGLIPGNMLVDEPFYPDFGGVFTKAILDRMAAYVKAIWPNMPQGVHMGPMIDWRANERYSVVDYVNYQYSWQEGSVTAFRDAALARGVIDNVVIIFSLNLLNGGIKVNGCFNGAQCCPTTGSDAVRTGGVGVTVGGAGQNCRMRWDQVRDWAIVLGTAGAGLTLWRYDTEFMARTDNQQAFREIAEALAPQSRPRWSLRG